MHDCRFPRFIRIRDDKRPEEASGPEVICELFDKQTRKVQPAGARTSEGTGKGNGMALADNTVIVEGDIVQADAEKSDGEESEGSLYQAAGGSLADGMQGTPDFEL